MPPKRKSKKIDFNISDTGSFLPKELKEIENLRGTIR